jgi:hypothetical protein
VDVYDAVDAFIFFLERYEVLYGSKVVADVLPARGPGTGKNTALHFASLCLEKDNINEWNGARQEESSGDPGRAIHESPLHEYNIIKSGAGAFSPAGGFGNQFT